MSTSKNTLRIAVDIGGTFTDLACFDEATGAISFGKALSTHGELVKGIQDTLDGVCFPGAAVCRVRILSCTPVITSSLQIMARTTLCHEPWTHLTYSV